MKRMHIHVGVEDLGQSIQFYSTLFGAPPNVTKDVYAKWMLDDPAVNFAISLNGEGAGIDHIGIQTGDREGLDEISQRLKAADADTFDQEATSCCYAVSDKTWVEDPSGIRWETFFTHGESTVYGEDAAREELAAAKLSRASTAACCGPTA
jgi:catechol 2,3-dioxygenase-like lactoylglutathione lyase family enzyme